jgi:hypothetical protein
MKKILSVWKINMAESKKLLANSIPWQGLLGCILISCAVLLPEIASWWGTEPGFVWHPVQDFNHRFGDLYYYALGVKSILEGNLFLHQTAPHLLQDAGTQALVSVETARILPYWFAALPRLFTADFRWVVVLGTALSSFLITMLSYTILRALRCTQGQSLVGSILFLFFLQCWNQIPPAAGIFSSGNFLEWIRLWKAHIRLGVKATLHLSELELLNDHFRYVMPSFATPLLLGYCLGLFAFQRRLTAWSTKSLLAALGLLLYSIGMGFTYPSHTLICYGLLFICFVYQVCARQYRLAAMLLAIGCVTLLVLIIGGYIGFLANTYGASIILQQVYSPTLHSTLPTWSIGEYLERVVLNRYMLTYLPIYWALRQSDLDKKTRKLIAVAFGVLTLVISLLLYVANDDVISRMTVRGLDCIWFLGIVILLIRIVTTLPLRVRGIIMRSLALSVVLIPLSGLGMLSYHRLSHPNSYITEPAWEAVEWASQHLTAHDTVATLDFADAHLLSFGGAFQPYITYLDHSGLRPEENIRRYIALWKWMKMGLPALQSRAANAVSAERTRLTEGWKHKSHPPYLSDAQFEQSQFVFMLLYYPYIQYVQGPAGQRIPIADQAQKRTHPAFTKWVTAEYRQIFAPAYLAQNPIHYLLVNKRDYPVRAAKLRYRFTAVYENEVYVMYRCQRHTHK